MKCWTPFGQMCTVYSNTLWMHKMSTIGHTKRSKHTHTHQMHKQTSEHERKTKKPHTLCSVVHNFSFNWIWLQSYIYSIRHRKCVIDCRVIYQFTRESCLSLSILCLYVYCLCNRAAIDHILQSHTALPSRLNDGEKKLWITVSELE